ncbi:RNA-binding Raly-like protein isoform X1 [Parus major]|uniref:RNA-binding Raly-like protein isoform X1 n=1 Tax=Parus major TaxID=9157 RepID=UPI001443F2BF|nr:RNA-binding Raly-like protein isoform X1 [Parus major]
MTLFGSGDPGWRYLDMSRESKLSRARLGQKRQHSSSLYHSNCDLDYDLYRDDFPYRVYEYQKIPPLINCIPVKTRRTHSRAGSKSSLSPQPGTRSSTSSSTGRTKLQAEELHSIKGELSQIKAQVDSLLESLDRMDQRRERLTGSKEREKKRAEPGTESSSPAGEGSQESRGKEGTRADGDRDLCNIDSAEESTDTEETVRGGPDSLPDYFSKIHPCLLLRDAWSR